MSVLQQPDGQIEELSASASFEAENCLGMADLTPSFASTCDLQYPTPKSTQNNFQETGFVELPTYTFSQDFQLSEYGIFNLTCDPPMSFRDRHRFLDGVYNSCPDPALITAEDMGDVARKVGLLMEEVLSWFKDEKARRAELLANDQHQAQKSTCQFPPSPKSIRGSGEVSSASPSYNNTSPGTPLKPVEKMEISSPSSASVDQDILAPPKAKRGRPAKSQVKIEPDLPSPDAKRKKISVKYPCPDCQNYVAIERWAEHINRKHYPEYVWECPKTNRQTGKPCSSNPHYRPAYRPDNFATHLKGEHDCPDTEIVELKKSCKFDVMDFFHKVCGFESCGVSLRSRDESIEHIKDHFRKTSEGPNPPVDLGVSLWKEQCGVEHKLQLGIHYRRSLTSKPDPMDEEDDHDHDEDGNGGSDEGNSDKSGRDNPDSRSNNKSHDHDEDVGNGASGEGHSDSPCHDSSGSQPNNKSDTHDLDEDRRSSQDGSDCSGDPRSIDATFPQHQLSTKIPKMDFGNAPDLPSISSLLLPHYYRRSVTSIEDSPSPKAPRQLVPAAMRTRKLTSEEDANLPCHVEGCDKLLSQSCNLTDHLETHHKAREYSFPCTVTDCEKKFEGKTDLESHHQNVHVIQQNRCEHCSRAFARKDKLRRHIEDGCSKSVHVEPSGGVSIADQTYRMPSPRMGSCKEGVDFPLYPNPSESMSQPSWTSISSSMMARRLVGSSLPRFELPSLDHLSQKHKYASYATSTTQSTIAAARSVLAIPSHTMESPELQAPSNYSTASYPSASFSFAMDSPYSIRTPQYGMGTPEFRTSSNSTTPGSSAISLMGSPYSIHGYTVPVPEWTPGLGLNPSIVSYENFGFGSEYSFAPSGMDDFNLEFNSTKANGFVDASILYPQQTARPTSAAHSNFNSHPYPLPSYPDPPPFLNSGDSRRSTLSNVSRGGGEEKGRCPMPDCGKIYQDVKAHMLTHQNERPEKCPIETCDYHIKGFARKYDKNRHALTHYKGTMVCGFCPGIGSVAEKSFNRADVFKRHLTIVHGVEQTPPNGRKKTSGAQHVDSRKKLEGYAPDATGKCSTCSGTFGNAQDFYEHLDDCVLRIVQQEEPSEVVNATRLAEVEQDESVHQTLCSNTLPTTTISQAIYEVEDDEEFDDDDNDDFTLRRKARRNPLKRPLGLTQSRGGVTLSTKSRKKRKDYPSSWGCPTSQMKMKKRVLYVFDGQRRLWNDDMMPDPDYKVRMKLSDEKSYVTDLDVQTMKRAEAFHKVAGGGKGPWIVDDDLSGIDLEKLMEVKRE